MLLGCAKPAASDASSVNDGSSNAESSKPLESSVPAASSASSTISSSQVPTVQKTLPVLKFTFDKTGANADFATKATKSDLSRPEVAGKFSLSNCDASMMFTDVAGGLKVRGNQTAGWAKKGFRIKFNGKRNMLGLNKGNMYKKWVLLADAKDTTLIRTAAGLYLARGVISEGDKVWSSDFTPVSVYLNDDYWGIYYLCEQKEVKAGRVQLAEPEDQYKGVDIGYCFELDHYADSAGSPDEASEVKKGADGDPTFRMKYSPKMEQGRPSGPLATGQVNTYTLLSAITDGPNGVHIEADYTNLNNGQLTNNSQKTSNSEQLTFIRDRMEALYQVLYYASKSTAKDIDENNQVISTSMTVQQAVEKHFNLNAWVDGYIINAYSVPPDLGYSSFYMSFDNTPTGDHKLRYDVPWDFDSNFANRNNFYVNAQGDEYCDNTYNTWLYLFSKLTFFKNMVKTKWNQIRDNKLFENMFDMMRTFWSEYDGEIQKDHKKWPQNDAAHQPPNNFDEIREPFKDPAKYKEAEAETLSWCSNRVSYLDSKWSSKTRAKIDASL